MYIIVLPFTVILIISKINANVRHCNTCEIKTKIIRTFLCLFSSLYSISERKVISKLFSGEFKCWTCLGDKGHCALYMWTQWYRLSEETQNKLEQNKHDKKAYKQRSLLLFNLNNVCFPLTSY